ncbi:MAG: glycosyltransferase [Thermococcus sp.]
MWHVVSFTIVAKKHISYMRKLGLAKIYELDERNIRHFQPAMKLPIAIHPFFFNAERLWPRFLDRRTYQVRQDYIDSWRSMFEKVVGVDVADSDHISQLGLTYLQITDRMVVPSTWAKEAYIRSGYTKPVFVVPHGVDPDWYTRPNVWESGQVPSTINPTLVEIAKLKRRGYKIILFWLWHSADRKGWPEVKAVYEILKRKHPNYVLVVKTVAPMPPEVQQVIHLGVVNVYGWLSEDDKIALYDLADVNLNFSRGGGFEMNCLEALARGVPCVAGEKGGWSDYVPPFLSVKQCGRVQPLPGNKIHDGWGYKVCIEEAIEKIEDILENCDDYKGKVEEWKESVLQRRYRWDEVAKEFYKSVFVY